jgi:hypothetical protein
MNRLTYRARGTAAAALAAAGCFLLSACDPKQELLAPQQPGVISPGSVNSATAADALYVGAIGRLNAAMNLPTGSNGYEGLINWEALFSDEIKSADTFSQRDDDDQRNLQTFDGGTTFIYGKTQQVRGFAREAINALEAFDTQPTGVVHTAEMYFVMGYTEMQLSAVFCNGIPFGETVDGVPTYTTPITDAAGTALAISRFDTALTILAGVSDPTVASAAAAVKNATLIAKARAQVDLKDYAGAATTVASVPTNFNYTLDYSITTSDNAWWTYGPSIKRWTIGDSTDVAGQIANAIPFAELNDPRVPVSDTKTKGEDNSTEFITTSIWNRDDPLTLESGIDARLIEAEAKLNANDITGMMTTLNALRASAQTLGKFSTPVMTALAAPADAVSARKLFFREKALWQFGRGYRMDDLRRLVRQYGLPQDQVFPSGNFVRNGSPSGTYGTQTNFAVPDAEKANPNFTGCLDRNP